MGWFDRKITGASPGTQFHAFDLMRLAAASLVLFSHVFLVTGRFTGPGDGAVALGELAVDIFFVISGFLIAKSWEATRRLSQFALNRFLRIFPALCVVVLFTAFALGPAVTVSPLRSYFGDNGAFRYLLCAVLDFQRSLPGVFVDNPYSGPVNDSIWTLTYEGYMYVLLGLCGLCAGRYFRYVVLIVYLVLTAGCLLTGQGLKPNFSSVSVLGVFFHFGTYFFAGALAWAFREGLILRGSLVLVCIGVLFVPLPPQVVSLVWNFTLPYMVLWLGLRGAPRWTAHFQKNDYSYGIYIWAFPIQQFVAAAMHTNSFQANLAVSALIVAAAAACSWHFIERPFLRLKRRGARQVPPEPLQLPAVSG